ncbi:MAG: hypothetical protein WCD70_03060 [Alphaproteobacteria bacterium]
MIAVGMLGVLLWRLVEVIEQEKTNKKMRRQLFIQVTCVSVLLVLIKQGDLELLGLLMLAFLVVGAKCLSGKFLNHMNRL